MSTVDQQQARPSPLDAFHQRRGAKMVPFAGYLMPLNYGTGIIAEHRHTRAQANLFDVSHMGQVMLRRGSAAAVGLETLVPADLRDLGAGHTRYTMFTNAGGGIIDDLMVSDLGDRMFLVVNAANTAADHAHLKAGLPDTSDMEVLRDRALIALQGPAAADAMADVAPAARLMAFMTVAEMQIVGVVCLVTRSGYTGEDGFEISLPAEAAEELAEILTADGRVIAAGLGARDTLRLEAGLCLHGADITEETTPVEAGLAWTIGKRRRIEGGFPGAGVILGQLAAGPPRRRVGIRPQGRAPARAGTTIVDAAGAEIGGVTSGLFGPTVDGPVAMGYVAANHAAAGTAVGLVVRGKTVAAEVVKLPFVPHRYHKG